MLTDDDAQSHVELCWYDNIAFNRQHTQHLAVKMWTPKHKKHDSPDRSRQNRIEEDRQIVDVRRRVRRRSHLCRAQKVRAYRQLPLMTSTSRVCSDDRRLLLAHFSPPSHAAPTATAPMPAAPVASVDVENCIEQSAVDREKRIECNRHDPLEQVDEPKR